MNKVGERLAEEIREKGAISFARFMELALYCPKYGYYETERDIIGRRGDYYTSVSAGSLFGELLAFQFSEWLHGDERLGRAETDRKQPETPQIVEAGAHDGCLAKDILSWLRDHRPSVYERVSYWIVEPSEGRRNRQQEHLGGFVGKVSWAKDMGELAAGLPAGVPGGVANGIQGIVFSNELLDSMPVHRLGWDAQRRAWFEWGVTFDAGRFVWARLAEADFRAAGLQHAAGGFFASILAEFQEHLPEGFTVEYCPAAEQWWRAAASALHWGVLMTSDYGLTAEELLVPERQGGTLRAYQQHHASSDLLASPGEQDITAHVNFTAIRAAGESAGLRTEAFQTQAQFLTSIASRAFNAEGFVERWTSRRTREFQTLTHPEHLGRAFRVLVQSRIV